MRSRAIVVASALSAALVSGGWLMQRGFHARAASAGGGARLFDDVASHVRRFYVDTIADSSLYQKAMEGVLLELHDPHSVYLSPERLARLNESTTGRYAGIGIQMDLRDGWITVVAPLAGTPAERAGLETGDRIVEIEGRSTKEWTAEEALKALRGQPGTTVRLKVERPGVDEPLPFTVQRQEIQFHAVQRALMLRDSVGLIDLTTFSEDAATDLRRAVDSLRRVGMKGLVLDLRGNPGGLLEQGVDVSDLFLDPGQKIVSMRGRTADATREFVDRAPQPFRDLPMVVLVDSSSASASEIVAGALQDHDRAAVVGTASYGKGSAQSLFRMADGGALKLTTALWYTPSGRSINRARVVREEGDEDRGSLFTVDTSEAPRRLKTDMGRTVTGGGGIHPDVLVEERALSQAEQTFERALGADVPKFRDALVAYAIDARARRRVTTPDFVVTPEMRAELLARMRERGIDMEPQVYAAAAPLVDRLLGGTVAQYVFGRQAAAARAARDDATVARAIELLKGAKTPREVIDRTVRR